MYIKVSTGSRFGAAAQYNETGLSEQQQKQKAGQVRYLEGYNLLANDAPGIAAEMGAVASRSRTQQPVWNVSFSVGDGQALTDQQWLGVVEQYMKAIGTSTDRHQVAVWRHSDTGRDHIHALINAVPTDGERALKRYQCGIRAKQAAQQIDTSLSQPILKGEGIRETIAQAIRVALTETKLTTFDELVTGLKEVGITAKITLNATGGGGTSFKMGNHKPVKGSVLGYKFAEVANQLAANQAYQMEIDQLKKDLEEAKKKSAETVTITKEVIKSNPKDTAEIKRLRQVEKDLIDQVEVNYDAWEKEKERADKVPETITKVVTVPDPADLAEIKQLRDQRDEAYKKRDQMREAYLNKPTETVIRYVETIKEVTKRDPADQVEIERLKKRERDLVDYADKVINTTNAIVDDYKKALSDVQAIKAATRAANVAKAATPPVAAPQPVPTPPAPSTAAAQWTTSFRNRFKADPTPQQIQDLLARKHVPVSQLGLTVWVADGKWQTEPLRPVATPPTVAQTLSRTPTPIPPKTATPAPEPPTPGPTVSSEPDWYESFRKLTRQKKSYLGAWDLEKHISESRATNALKLTLHQENGELCLTDQHNRTATFTQLGLDWKKLGITGLDKNNILDLKRARGKGHGRSM